MRKTKLITLRDVATKTGYTVNTVSRALKDKNDIAKSTIEYIKSVADEMGYINDNIASSMRTGRTGTISVILSDITNPFFALAVRRVEKLASEYNLSVFILNTDEEKEKEYKAIKTSLEKKVDGILICPCPDSCDNLDFLRRMGIPYVLFGRIVGDHRSVIQNDTQSGYLATKHLIETCGKKRILCIKALDSISSARQRFEGYKQALSEDGLTYDKELVFETSTKTGSIENIMSDLKKKNIKFDGIFAYSDLLAFEAISCLNKNGIRVPEDIAVAGVDNLHEELKYMPPIDSVGAAEKSMSEAAFEILMCLINEEPVEYPLHTELDVKMFARAFSS